MDEPFTSPRWPIFGFMGVITTEGAEALYDAISEPGGLRLELKAELAFLLIVIALVLPIKTFFLSIREQPPTLRPSARLVGFCLTGVLVLSSALYAWLRVVVYEIPITRLHATDDLPPPPAPPDWK